MQQTGIYIVTCLETGEQYIGQSRDIPTRWQRHRTLLQQGRHSRLWQEAWDRYGPDAFAWEVLEEVSDWRRLNERERHYIRGLRPVFNDQPLVDDEVKTAKTAGVVEPAESVKTFTTADGHEWTVEPSRVVERYISDDGPISIGMTIIHEGEPSAEYRAMWRHLLLGEPWHAADALRAKSEQSHEPQGE